MFLFLTQGFFSFLLYWASRKTHCTKSCVPFFCHIVPKYSLIHKVLPAFLNQSVKKITTQSLHPEFSEKPYSESVLHSNVTLPKRPLKNSVKLFGGFILKRYLVLNKLSVKVDANHNAKTNSVYTKTRLFALLTGYSG